MDSQRKKEIKAIAEKVTKTSEKFQLIHATYAIQVLIKQSVIENQKKKCDELRKIIEEKMDKGLDCKEQLKEQENLQRAITDRNFRIDVEYIESFPEEMARIIMINNAFVINLPKKLADQVFVKEGEYNYPVIRKIRSLMAHELGHLMLHTDELLDIHGTQGSLKLDKDEKEREAEYFAENLIELRKQRNQKVYQDGGAHKLYDK